MKSKGYIPAIFWILNFVFLFPSALLAMEDIDWAPAPELTNSNVNLSAYFWVKTSDGKTKIVELPPESRMKLPADTVNFQYLYMEKGRRQKSSTAVTPETVAPSNTQEQERELREQAEEEALKAIASEILGSPAEENQTVSFESIHPRPLPAIKIVPSSERFESPGKFERVRRFFEEHW